MAGPLEKAVMKQVDRKHRRQTLAEKTGVSQSELSAKIAKITREEKRKPKGKRRSRKAIAGKAAGILRG